MLATLLDEDCDMAEIERNIFEERISEGADLSRIFFDFVCTYMSLCFLLLLDDLTATSVLFIGFCCKICSLYQLMDCTPIEGQFFSAFVCLSFTHVPGRPSVI